jgi:hypothetical protein
MSPEHITMQSIARRLEAGTYQPKRTALVTIPAVNNRPMRHYAAEILGCAAMGGAIGFLLGGGL